MTNAMEKFIEIAPGSQPGKEDEPFKTPEEVFAYLAEITPEEKEKDEERKAKREARDDKEMEERNERMEAWKKLMHGFSPADQARFAKETKAIRNKYSFPDWDKKSRYEKDEINKKRRAELSEIFRSFGLMSSIDDQGREFENPSPDKPEQWTHVNNLREKKFDPQNAEHLSVSYDESERKGSATYWNGKFTKNPTVTVEKTEEPKEKEEAA
jgi:hypothetical protein